MSGIGTENRAAAVAVSSNLKMARGLAVSTVAALLVIQTVLLAYSATRHSPTMLEPAQLAAGILHWTEGRFDLGSVNPPLVGMLAALPVLAQGVETDWHNLNNLPGGRPDLSVGSDFVRANGQRSQELFTLARWACIPFSLLGCLFCYLWATDLYGNRLFGVFALFLLCFCPNILGHAAAAFGVGASYLFWRWLKSPGWAHALLAGVMLGFAQLSKMITLQRF